MKNHLWQTSARAIAAAMLATLTCAAADLEPGFRSLFNGKDLTGWAGRPQHWSVVDGAITGITTKENPAQGNNFLIAKDGDQELIVSDFELRFSYRFTGPWGNSGAQYRSVKRDNFVVHGYQADFEVGTSFSGILYEEGGRGILAERGKKTVVKEVDGKTKVEVVGSVGESQEIQALIKTNGWNDYVVIAQGNHLQHFINGKATVDVVDEQTSKAAKSGILALQLHAGPPMKVQFKDLRIKPLDASTTTSQDLELMQGEWVPVEVIVNGSPVPSDAVGNIKVKIQGKTYAVEGSDRPDQGTFELKEGASPKGMDISDNGGGKVLAIYELTKGVFKACYAGPGAARPTEFKSKEGSDWTLITYKRK
jgi:uncharacterized protein (TIGR03067 family)